MTSRARVPRFPALCAALLLLSCGDGPTGPTAADFPDEPAPTPHPEVVAFVGVDVVPMDSDRVLADQTVVVRGEIIEAIGATGSVEIPEGAFEILGQGRYLAPGLADMHVHTTSGSVAYRRNDFVLWLANGVTTIRVMWGGPGILAERDRVASGEVLGPTAFVASPGLDAPGGVWTASTPPVATPEEARDRVAQHAAEGYDLIKVYNDLDRATYDAIVDEADARGIPVVGHVPSRVGLSRVQDARQRSLEHFIGVKFESTRPMTGGTVDMAQMRAAVARSAAAGVWQTPTISVLALSQSQVASTRAGDALPHVSPGIRSFFENGFFHGLSNDVAAREAANVRAMILAVHEAGGGLLVGTDAGFGWILPGYSIHDELESFVEAGIGEFAALRAATTSAAESVGRSDFGRVAVGMRADLMLLARNPLEDVAAYRESSGTMVRGRWLSRGTLRAMLDEIRAAYGG